MTKQEDRGEVAKRLRRLAPLVLRCWEDRVRDEITAAQHEDRLILFDEIPLFLARVIQALAGELNGEESCAQDEVCMEHGTQRASETDYPLSAVVQEYFLLRKTICEILEAEAPLGPSARETITDCIEIAMREASDRFAKVHQTVLEERAAALAKADEHKNEFVTTLAHELRTPLSAITNALFILENVTLDDRAIRHLSTVQRQTKNLARLVDDMLDIGRISQGKVDLRRETFCLAAAARSAAEAMRPLIESRGQDLILAAPSDAVTINADPTRVEQILMNLLNNAIKYTEPGGSIWLTIECDGGDALIVVKDTGIGIDPVILPQIFDLFMQVDPSNLGSQNGLGIGLSLVKRLVEMQGGTISADSRGAGQGAEFRVRLPLAGGT